MQTQELWQLFLDTGAPEAYLLYSNARRMEGAHVPNNKGFGTTDNRI